jgi:hypothetical protein
LHYIQAYVQASHLHIIDSQYVRKQGVGRYASLSPIASNSTHRVWELAFRVLEVSFSHLWHRGNSETDAKTHSDKHFFLWRCSPTWAYSGSLLKFLWLPTETNTL